MEGCPTSVIEAMASGLFVVSTNVGALNEIVNTSNGRKIKPKNVEELKEALLYCLKNINEIRNLKSKIIKNSNDNFEVSIISKSFETNYNSLLKNEKLS